MILMNGNYKTFILYEEFSFSDKFSTMKFTYQKKCFLFFWSQLSYIFYEIYKNGNLKFEAMLLPY